MINLTAKCQNIEIDQGSPMTIRLLGIANHDEIAQELAECCNIGLLITENNQDEALDQITIGHLKEHLRDREGP